MVTISSSFADKLTSAQISASAKGLFGVHAKVTAPEVNGLITATNASTKIGNFFIIFSNGLIRLHRVGCS
jgi:hypothetical protein